MKYILIILLILLATNPSTQIEPNYKDSIYLDLPIHRYSLQYQDDSGDVVTWYRDSSSYEFYIEGDTIRLLKDLMLKYFQLQNKYFDLIKKLDNNKIQL